MASYLIDKLEELKEEENKLKEQQRVLMEEIELDIEKKRRLELDGTIIKLRTQVEDFTKNIEGEIIPDNRMLVLSYGKHNYTHEEQQEIGQLRQYNSNNSLRMTTLEKFKNNLSKLDEWMNNGIPMHERKQLLGQNMRSQNLLEIPPEIKIYDDVIPIFTTMIGIMKKQEFEIDNLKKKMEDHVHFVL
tara:strand:+ start:2216 stop:2779 length:564 start_codon:yes stop_codon:yes gene_type:complete